MNSLTPFFRTVLTMFVSLASLAAEEPFALETTPGKLPKDVLPTHYAVTIDPDIAQARFTGEETITLEVRKPVRRLVLNSLGLTISRASLDSAPDRTLTPQLDEAAQTLTLDLPEELPAGRHALRLTFHGSLNEQPHGLYLVRYEAGGETFRALATQMEATDARRMFPCWDEPVFRARFGLTVLVDPGHLAMSNMPIVAEAAAGASGRKRITFADTPSMASYLVVLCVGEFEELHDQVDGIALRILTTKGKRERGRYAMEATKRILPYYNAYFGLNYPLPKLDQIALSSTGASGMENWGGIVYHENALLVDDATSAQGTRERVFNIVAHEIAHQWFGNLVTMAWWDNLWLNEGFASWMATKASDHFNPDWKCRIRATGAREAAMDLDARATTHPIQQPVATEFEAMNAFDQITYQKGQAFLTMLESWLGPDAFQDGLRGYMQRHAYSSTTTADLWTALEGASQKPVRSMAERWTQQPGFPVVKVEPAENPDSIRLTQERFTIHQKNAAPLLWQIPIRIAHATPGPITETTLAGPSTIVPLAPGADVILNAGSTGYYRVQYPEAELDARFAGALAWPEIDRIALHDDTWALVEADRMPIQRYLALLRVLAEDRSPILVVRIIGTLSVLDRVERGTAGHERFRQWARAILAPHLARIGWEPQPQETPLETSLRGSLIGMLGHLGEPAVIAEAEKRFEKFRENSASLAPDLRGAVLGIVGRRADRPRYDAIRALGRKEDDLEQKNLLYNAIASASDPELAAITLRIALTDELPPSDATRLVSRVAFGGEHPVLAWDFARQHRDALYAKIGGLVAQGYLPSIARAFIEEDRAAELEALALPPGSAKAVAETADDIRFMAELKRRFLPGLDAWCAAGNGQ